MAVTWSWGERVASRWIACGLLVACSDEAPAPLGASAPPSSSVEAPPAPLFRYVMLEQDAKDLDERVAEHARIARAESLIPIVHLSTVWNTGGRLRKHKDDPEVQQALRGVYLIDIDFPSADECTGTCPNAWADVGLLCSTWAQTLYVVDERGRPGAPSATPGKNGPESAAENAEMIAAFRRLYDRGDRERCMGLRHSR